MKKLPPLKTEGFLLAMFVRHRTAAHILMALMVVLGYAGFLQLNVKFFPTVEVQVVSVTIAWPGASAESVDEAIIAAVEPSLRFIDGVIKVTSNSFFGSASISLEFKRGSDMQKAIADVETAVEQITTLPADAERARVVQATFLERVASLLIYGDFSEAQLKGYAKRARDELLALGVDSVKLSGARDEEILVEIDPDQLRRYGLTHSEVAGEIADSSLDLPGGTLRGDIERQVRAAAQMDNADGIGGIELRRFASGDALLVRDVAQVSDGFDADQPTGWRRGQPAIRLHIERSENANSLDVAALVRQWLAEAPQSYPSDLNLQLVDVQSDKIIQRITVLLKNGAGGVVLVLVLLFLFLRPRAAMWVAIGMPVAMMGALGLMWPLGLSINMLSMFALIMTIGIIVDDTIVVGEHTVSLAEMGAEPDLAAEGGARRMAPPVIAAALTTLAAFLPMLVLDNVFGDVVRPIPIVVLAVLAASLVECFLILPHHMSIAFRERKAPPATTGPLSYLRRWQKAFTVRFEAFREGRFRDWVERSFEHRYEVLASAIGAFILSLGVLMSGVLPFSFFPSPEAEIMEVSVNFHPGTPRNVTARGLAVVEESLFTTEAELINNRQRRLFGILPPAGDDKIIFAVFSRVGTNSAGSGAHRATVWVELVSSEERNTRTETFRRAWEKNLPVLSGAADIRILERRAGPPGEDIDVRLERADAVTLKKAALELKARLGTLPGVYGLSDSLDYDKESLLISVTPYGAALGFDNRYLGQVLRNGLYGAIAKRFARGDEEVKIRVSLPQAERGIASMELIDVRVPNATANNANISANISANNDGMPSYVPLASIVEWEEEPGFSSIRRLNGVRAVQVIGSLDATAGNLGNVSAVLRDQILPELVDKYQLSWSLGGRNEDQNETLARLQLGAFLALGLIYVVLAFVFSSFTRPGVIMSIIPFGFVGAVMGHLVQNFNLTFLSLIGLLALSGILVNNSIILITRMEERMRVDKEDLREAVLGAVQDRLRAVVLTSGTTILGLTPLLFETSLQAQFLLPMAITLVWGLALATFLILFLVPALLGIGEDWRQARLRRAEARVMLARSAAPAKPKS